MLAKARWSTESVHRFDGLFLNQRSNHTGSPQSARQRDPDVLEIEGITPWRFSAAVAKIKLNRADFNREAELEPTDVSLHSDVRVCSHI